MSGKVLPVLLSALLLAACSSTPTWEGMSETEISDWKALSVDVASAQEFREAGLKPSDVDAWQQAGLRGTGAILDWRKTGFSPTTAQPWVARGVGLETATTWAKEKFTAEEATVWNEAGFSLKEAIDNREKGLTPVR